MLSKTLLEAITSWKICLVPAILHHGCRSDDIGIDISNHMISGDKWFSVNSNYAGDYAWHHSREKPGQIFTGIPYLLELNLVTQIQAVHRPLKPNGKDFNWFLADCFPDIPIGYGLSKHFQSSLSEHLRAVHGNGNVVAYLMEGGEEVLIPNCESYVRIVRADRLPDSVDEYRKSQLTLG